MMNSNLRRVRRPRIPVSVSAAGLFLLTVLSRIPFRTQILYHWDSVNFAFAMRRFDVAADQPHPPGYILYVWLSRLVDLLFNDANATMVWISVVASGLAVVLLYLVGRALWSESVGWVAALLLSSSPLFWFYGEIALPHTLDTVMVLLSAWLLWRVRRGERRMLWPAVVVLGIAGGVRPQTLVFLLPLALYAVARVGAARLAASTALGSAVCLAWFVPLTASAGGLGPYLEAMAAFSSRFQQTTSVLIGAGWRGVVYNLRKLLLYTLYGGATAWIPFLLSPLTRLLRRSRPSSDHASLDRCLFLVLWSAPALLFYTLIHMGQQGLVFVFLPVLVLLGALGLVRLVRGRWLWAAAALLALVNVSLFCLAPEHPLGPQGPRFLTRATLYNSDRYYLDRLATVREHFPPNEAAIVAANWRHLEYYLSAYPLLRLDQGPPNRPFALTPRRWPGHGRLALSDLGLEPGDRGTVALVIFDEVIGGLYSIQGPTTSLPLPGGGEMEVIWLMPGQALRYDGTALEVVGR